LVKLFGRGHIDYGNKLSMTKLMTIVKPEECNSFINEGYETNDPITHIRKKLKTRRGGNRQRKTKRNRKTKRTRKH
jgi:hypothetical protein